MEATSRTALLRLTLRAGVHDLAQKLLSPHQSPSLPGGVDGAAISNLFAGAIFAARGCSASSVSLSKGLPERRQDHADRDLMPSDSPPE
jgi:hypothetical protein